MLFINGDLEIYPPSLLRKNRVSGSKVGKDMEPFSAAAVYETARSFEQLRATCNLIERFGKVRFSGSENSPNQMESIVLLPTSTRV
jgi:hypothetical protein